MFYGKANLFNAQSIIRRSNASLACKMRGSLLERENQMTGKLIQSDPITISIDSVTFQLQEPHNFDWLHDLGKVFCVFDQQDSGNICFGLEKDGNKKFIKYAGARPIDFHGNPQDAVRRLTQAIHLYSTLEHPYLIQLKDHFSLATGYAAIFDWVEGECLHSHWSFGGEAKYSNPNSPFFDLSDCQLTNV